MFKFLYSLISFAIAIFFIMLGALSVMVPWSATIRTDLIQFLLENSIAIALFGFGFIIIGFTMVIILILSFKKHHYHIRSGTHSVAVDEALIQQYLQSYWKQNYPDEEIPTRLTLKKNRIHIFADLPYAPPPEQKACIQQIQQDLRDIFSRILGYTNEFVLSITFPKK